MSQTDNNDKWLVTATEIWDIKGLKSSNILQNDKCPALYDKLCKFSTDNFVNSMNVIFPASFR